MKRLFAVATLLCFAQLACYNTYTISKGELEKLESGQERESVTIESTDGESVQISPETPLEVQVAGGTSFRITPYNFLLSDTQLVSPDYDLLLDASLVESAQVREISYGKTFGMVGAIVVGVGGGFAALMLTNQ